MISLLFAVLLANSAMDVPIPAREAATKPKFVSGADPGLQSEARALGHHGVVIAKATIEIDGRLTDIAIEQSSKSPILDSSVLAVLPGWKVTPAKDAIGNPIRVAATFPFSFEGDGASSWVARYRCDAFTRDMSWWRSVNPGKPDKDHKFYTMLIGVRVLASPGGMMEGLKTAGAAGAVDWDKAVRQCLSKPGELMIDQLTIASQIRALTRTRR